MYCFDSEASLKVVKEYATVRLDEMSTNISKGENDTYQTVINDILSCINFTYLTDKYQWVDEDPDDYFEKLHKLPYSHSVVAAFQNFNSFDGVDDLGTEELKEKDLTITKAQGEATKGQCDRNNNLKKLFRESNRKPSDDSNEEERTSNKVVKQLLKLLLNIDKKIFVNDFVKSYKDLEKLMPKELKDYEANYKQLLEDNKARLNQMIEDIRYKESHGKVDELLQGLSFSNSTDMKTPEALLDKMFEKLSNFNGTICDPCAGVGTMLLYAVEKYGFKKEYCYGIDIDEDNVKICKKLGFVNIIQGDAQDPKTWGKLNMNFDHIIMNPPYNGSLHLKILKEAIKHSKEVVNLSPANQMFSGVRLIKDHSEIKKSPELVQNIQDVDLIKPEEASAMFGASFAGPLMLIHYDLTKEGKDYKEFNIIPKNLRSVFDKTVRSVYEGKYPSLWSIIKEGDCPKDKFSLTCPEVHGHQGQSDWAEITSKNYEKALASKQRWGWHLEFDTEEDRKNCWECWHLKSHMLIHNLIKADNFNMYQWLPALDYTHPWTDEMLYEYFGLTEDEIKEIEQDIK